MAAGRQSPRDAQSPVSRMERRPGRRLESRVGRRRLDPLQGGRVGHPVGEQDAVQVVDLVLKDARQIVGRLDPELLAVEILRAHRHAVVARHLADPAGDAQAALVAGLRLAEAHESGLTSVNSNSSPSSWSFGMPMTTSRRGTPTCGAANLTPCAATIVSRMSAASRFTRSSTRPIFWLGVRRRSSGATTIGSRPSTAPGLRTED